jgi:ankyrin repeat protein
VATAYPPVWPALQWVEQFQVVCGDTALHIASRQGYRKTVQWLLDQNADTDTILNRNDETARQIAEKTGMVEYFPELD